MGAVFLGCLLKGPIALGAVPSALSPELGRKDGVPPHKASAK